MGFVIGAFVLLRPGRPWKDRTRNALLYAACSVPGCVAVAIIQQSFYGSPFRSGYGTLGQIFSMSSVVPNAGRYLGWLWQTHTAVVLLAIAAPFVMPGWLTALMTTLVVVNLLCYLPYTMFSDWSYLRFLLPTIPLLLVLMTASLDAICHRIGSRISGPQVWLKPDATGASANSSVVSGFSRTVVASGFSRTVTASALIVATVVLAVLFVREARARSAFDLQRLEARYEKAGTFVARRLPSNALVITSWESGSVRFYSRRPTLVWDVLEPAWLDRAITFASDRGFEPYLLFERWEEPRFRERFGGTGIAALDWPPMAEIAMQVRIYRPNDRERYRRNLATATEYVR
jgi:hypothetical protein